MNGPETAAPFFYEHDDGGRGELIPTPYYTAEDAPVQVGDECIVRVTRYRSSPHLRLSARVIAIFPGHELVIVVQPYSEGWTPMIVRLPDVARVMF